jgi:hypothetical protein
MFPMKYMLPGVGPKLGESVAAHPSYEAENGPHACIIYAGDTARTPLTGTSPNILSCPLLVQVCWSVVSQ